MHWAGIFRPPQRQRVFTFQRHSTTGAGARLAGTHLGTHWTDVHGSGTHRGRFRLRRGWSGFSHCYRIQCDQAWRFRFQILLGPGLKFLRTPGAAEVISGTCVLHACFCRRRIHGHPTHRISCQGRTLKSIHL
jgi:hypothetical protein